MRWLVRAVVGVIIILLLGCLGMGVPADILIALAIGWVFYLNRVIPRSRSTGMASQQPPSAYSASPWACMCS